MVQGRGPYLALVAAVDDATGAVPYALFREQEDAQGYFLLLREVVHRKGIPLALYSDWHGIFQRSPEGGRRWRSSSQGRGIPPSLAERSRS